jgi:hypothetical protein
MNNEKVGSQQDVLPLELVIRSSCGARDNRRELFQKKRGKASKLSNPRKEHAAKRGDPGVEL